MRLTHLCFKFFVVCITSIALIACIPHFKYPLTKPDKSHIDHSILGNWFWHEEFETGFLHIGISDKNPNSLHIVMLDIDSSHHLEIAEFSAHTSILNDHRYLNLRAITPEDPQPGYMLMKYKVEDSSISIAFIERTSIKSALEDDKLKGNIQSDVLFPSIFVTEKPRKLRRYISKNDSTLFKEMTTLQKFINPKSIMPDTTLSKD